MVSNNIIHVDFLKNNQTTSENKRVSILPAREEVVTELAEEHSAEPIKSLQDIERCSKFLIMNERYRDNMFFILGINMGLRISDLRQLRFCDLLNNNCTFKTTFPVLEKKTKNTRKVKKNRYISINQAVIEAVTLYLDHTDNVTLSDYLFQSQGRDKTKHQPLTRQQAYNICVGIKDSLGLDMRFSTHTLRKTFGYHQMAMSNNSPRKLLLLQKMFGHSSAVQTLSYIGLTEEEITDAYLNLNLGSDSVYSKSINSELTEDSIA